MRFTGNGITNCYPDEVEDFISITVLSPGFGENRQRLWFLRALAHEFALPIQANDEELDYIPTQVAAEYLHLCLGFDGLMYRSAQFGTLAEHVAAHDSSWERGDRNLALFGSAAMTTGESDAGGDQAGLSLIDGEQQLFEVVAHRLECRQVSPDDHTRQIQPHPFVGEIGCRYGVSNFGLS